MGGFDETPEHFAEVLCDYGRQGWLNIAGGCCGTGPENIAMLAQQIASIQPRQRPQRNGHLSVAGLEAYTLKPTTGFSMIGERTNITGSPKFAELIRQGDLEKALAVARQQVESGANLLDINMDLYGRHIDVVLKQKIRNEQRFASLEALKEQIANDVVTARQFFGLL
jgi:5-methyltetrahydrofolate--homocysteine methyltransferase